MNKIPESDVVSVRKLLKDVLRVDEYIHIERLGGLTNHTYKVVLQNGQIYAIRLPGEGTEELIDRENEKVSTQLACRLRLDAPLLFFGKHGEKVSRYIDGARSLCASDFSCDSVLKQAAGILRALHICGADTKVPFDVFDMAAEYERIIDDNAVALFIDYPEIKSMILRIRNYVTAFADAPLVPCHNDPLCENWVIDDKGKLFLIDWEYAGMNDGMWDLADLSVEAALSDVQEDLLLQFYLERKPTQKERIRFCANKLYLDFLWALWGKARTPFDGDGMEVYGQERYVRLKNNLARYSHLFPTMKDL